MIPGMLKGLMNPNMFNTKLWLSVYKHDGCKVLNQLVAFGKNKTR